MKQLHEAFLLIHEADIANAGLTFNARVYDCLKNFELNLAEFADLYADWKAVNA